MSVHQKGRRGPWYVSYRDSTGRQRTKTFGHGPAAKRAAEAYDLELKAARLRGERPKPAGGVYLDDLAEAYLRDRRGHGVSTSHLATTVRVINRALPLLPHCPCDQLTYADFAPVLDQYASLTTGTRNRYVGCLRSVFRWGIRHGLTTTDPLSQWRASRAEPRRSRLTVPDLERIISHAAPHLAWAIEVTYNLGVRPGQSELFALRWEDVDWDRGCVRIYGRKTKRWRDVPFGDGFRRRLLEMRAVARSEYLVEYAGHQVRRMQESWATACRRAGITYPCCLYDIRHLFATAMLARGADLAAVSHLLGHRSILMTANVYYDLMSGERRRAVSLLPEIETPAARQDGVIPLRPRNVIR